MAEVSSEVAPIGYPSVAAAGLISCLCTEAQLRSPNFLFWMRRYYPENLDAEGQPIRLRRKMWERLFITQALWERGLLQPGRRGLGFAVGQEPNPACFAGLGCTIVATDLDEDQNLQTSWLDFDQQSASGLERLYRADLCEEVAFRQRVSFRPVDMNQIPSDLVDFDFAWSSCAFEHLGSIERGLTFLYRMMDCLKPGGVAVHTTEFNLTSNQETVDHARTVLFRQRDIEAIAQRLRQDGHQIQLDYHRGNQPADLHVEPMGVPPFGPNPRLKLQLGNYVTTSIGLIITKAAG